MLNYYYPKNMGCNCSTADLEPEEKNNNVNTNTTPIPKNNNVRTEKTDYFSDVDLNTSNGSDDDDGAAL